MLNSYRGRELFCDVAGKRQMNAIEVGAKGRLSFLSSSIQNETNAPTQPALRPAPRRRPPKDK